MEKSKIGDVTLLKSERQNLFFCCKLITQEKTYEFVTNYWSEDQRNVQKLLKNMKKVIGISQKLINRWTLEERLHKNQKIDKHIQEQKILERYVAEDNCIGKGRAKQNVAFHGIGDKIRVYGNENFLGMMEILQILIQ